MYFLNVKINASTNDYSFKYICVLCYLKSSFLLPHLFCNVEFESIQLISQHRTVVRNFQNKANFEIIGFASDSSDTDLRDIDLLDEEKLCM